MLKWRGEDWPATAGEVPWWQGAGLPQQVCVQAHGVYADSEAPRNRT